MAREIKLDGGEITVLKAIGTSGAQIAGKILAERVSDLEPAEFLHTLSGLLAQDYVVSNKVNVRTMDDVEHAFFSVSPGVAKDLRGAINPGRSRDVRDARRDRRG